jgi:uncharacterized lipoprotein YehR (DUF1307 family)
MVFPQIILVLIFYTICRLFRIINISLRRQAKMKSKLITMLLVMLLVVAGCSSSGDTNTPEGKIATINTMMAKGYVMSKNQRETINQQVAESKTLLSQGKKEEANKLLDEAIKLLEVIAETDRFNKSE